MERMIAHCCQNPTYVLIKSLCSWTYNQHMSENMKNTDGKSQGSSHTSTFYAKQQQNIIQSQQ